MMAPGANAARNTVRPKALKYDCRGMKMTSNKAGLTLLLSGGKRSGMCTPASAGRRFLLEARQKQERGINY